MGDAAAAQVASMARRYLEAPPAGDDPVVRLAGPDELRERFAAIAPIGLGDPGSVVEPLDEHSLLAVLELIVDYSVQTAHPRFFNQNFAGSDPVAVAADQLGAALNTTAATYEAAPVFTLIEDAVLRRLAALAGLGSDDALAPGLFAPGGSTGLLYALQLARHRRQPDLVSAGAAPQPLAIFVSAAGHYSARKSGALLGMGTDAVIEVGVDQAGAMRLDALAAAVAQSRDHGRLPLCVIATAGTTVSAAFDPIDAIADIAEAEDLWLHVDGAYGASALFSAAHRHRLAGVERADSLVWNLHKMMGITQQCTALLLADPGQLVDCFGDGADYLFQPDKLNADLDSGDRHFQCARRVDALKLWLTWRVRGDQGFAERIERAVDLADHARRWLAERDDFEVVVAGDFTNVIFRWLPPRFRGRSVDEFDDSERAELHAVAPRIKAALQRSGIAMVGFQPVHGINAFRLLIMNPAVTTADIDLTLTAIASASASR